MPAFISDTCVHKSFKLILKVITNYNEQKCTVCLIGTMRYKFLNNPYCDMT